jgi:hypothetical protein
MSTDAWPKNRSTLSNDHGLQHGAISTMQDGHVILTLRIAQRRIYLYYITIIQTRFFVPVLPNLTAKTFVNSDHL